MPFGVTTTGFNKKTLDDLHTEIKDDQRATIDPALNLGPDSVLGQLNGIMAERFAELWDLGLAIYRSFYPDSAEGDALEQIASLTGVERNAAAPSTVTVVASGTPATNLPAGRVISVTTTGARFTTLADAVIGGGGTVSIDCESEETGPVAAPAGTLTEIETPVSGWDSVTNALDAVLGTVEEGDAALRVRRIAELFNPGSTTVEAIIAAVSGLDGVTDVYVFENTDYITDGEGLPPKSFEVVVEGGDDTEIAQTIFDNKPAGIKTHGTTTEVISDSQGTNHDIKFSRPDDVDFWVTITVSVIAGVFGGGVEATGVAAVKEAIVNMGDALGIGDDVIALRVPAAALEVSGVNDVTIYKVDDVDPPVAATNVVLSNRQVADFDTSRVTVTVVYA